MSKRKHRRSDRKHKRTRIQSTANSSRRLFAAGLHRRPCLWDVLVHELAVVLSKRCREIRSNLSTESFRFTNEDSTTVGWMLARGFEILISRKFLYQQAAKASLPRTSRATATDCRNGCVYRLRSSWRHRQWARFRDFAIARLDGLCPLDLSHAVIMMSTKPDLESME